MNYKENEINRQYKLNKVKDKSLYIFSLILVLIGTFLMVFPYFYMIITALKTPQEMLSGSILKNFWPSNPVWSNFLDVFRGNERYSKDVFNFLDSFWNTLKIEILVVPIGTFFSSLAAFSFAKMKFRGKNVILIILLSSMMIPFAAVMLPQYRAFYSLGMVNTLWPLIIPGLFGNTGMMLFLITSMKNNIPDSLIEESKVEGTNYFKTYYKVALPLIKPALVAQMLFWFVGIYNDFFGPSIYLTDPKIKTVQVAIMTLNSTASQASTDIPFLMASAFISSLPIILLFIFMNKSFVQTNISDGIKG